ncbi:MAG TPA: hypothetical protein PKZ76_07355 [Xanthomonadaceae bacterium]|nr:hypothetical protein [Xanthomonadaceae bacterium]
MKRILAVLSVLLLSGCASYGSYRYVERSGGAGDYYYDRSYHGYGYYGDTWYGYPFDVAYAYYPYYYSLFWGFRPYYYDPFFSPGFYYGVTWFPRTWFSFSLGYHDWGYYHAYAPWRYSFWDNYYTWYHAPRRNWPGHVRGGHTTRFGSARNEAERIASLNSQARRGVRTALPADVSGDLLLGARSPRALAQPRTARGVPAASAGRGPAERAQRGEQTRRSARDEVRQPARRPPPEPSARVEHPQFRGESAGTWRASPRGGSSEIWQSGATPPPRVEPGGHVSRRPVGVPERRVDVPARAPDTVGDPRPPSTVLEHPVRPSAAFQRPAPTHAAPPRGFAPDLPARAVPSYPAAPVAPAPARASEPTRSDPPAVAPRSAPAARMESGSDRPPSGARGGRGSRQEDR